MREQTLKSELQRPNTMVARPGLGHGSVGRCVTFLISMVLSFGLATLSRADLLDDEGGQAQPKATEEPPGAKSRQGPAKRSATGDKDHEASGEEHGQLNPSSWPRGKAVGTMSPHPQTRASDHQTTVVPPKRPQSSAAKQKPKGSSADLPVHFDSRGLKALRDKGMVELMQDVVVTQGEMRLEAEQAQVFFEEGARDKKDRGLVKVIAAGHPVRIFGIDENSGERFRAFGNQAVFLNRERTVVLDGDAHLWRGEDAVIRSRKITYEMDSGWIRADRVAGELQPSEQKPAVGIGAGTERTKPAKPKGSKP